MGIRCELCDEFLPLFQLSRLCPNCYKIRTIVKCYDAEKVLHCLDKNFRVNYETETKIADTDTPVVSEDETEKPKTRSETKKEKKELK